MRIAALSRLTYITIISICLFLAETNSFAYNTQTNNLPPYGGHEEITGWSIDYLIYDAKLTEALNDNRDKIIKANAAEDSVPNPMNHFYSGFGWPSESAILRSKSLYKEALEKYRDGDKGGGWNKVGHALHLVQDMAAPSHAMDAPHMWHWRYKKGYEWWVSLHWSQYIAPQLARIFDNPNEKNVPEMGQMWIETASMGIMTRVGGYAYDLDTWTGNGNPLDPRNRIPLLITSPDDSYYNAMMLVPQAIKAGGHVFKGFWQDIGGGGPIAPAPSGPPGNGHPDDNFDVASRLVKLEELYPTGDLWKDLYGRVGVKKGYFELYFDKKLSQLYSNIGSAQTDDDFYTAYDSFLTALSADRNVPMHTFEDAYYSSPDVAILSNGYVKETANLLLKKLKEPIREITDAFEPKVLTTQPIFVIPSGALYGMENSAFFKSSLEEYVKNGGTLVVFTQQHGYEFSILPVPQEPDGSYRHIAGYGWEEDQNCFTNGVYIDTWHQMLSGQSRSTPTANVDGYFTDYPSNSTILLRRTANGQPALLMYEYGLGRVIVTSMYSDWAYGHGQTSQEEIALVGDIISWSKKPGALPEIRPGEAITVPVTIANYSGTDAATVKFQIYNPDRSSVLAEYDVNQVISNEQSETITVSFSAPADSTLGIHHIDYILLDSTGNVIQPQAETDSGRFVVSNPPQTGVDDKPIRYSVSTTNQSVFFGSNFDYTFHVFNNTNETRNLTIKTWLPHTNRRKEWTVTAAPHTDTTVSGSDQFIDSRWMFETLRTWLYDESGTEIGNYMLSFKGTYPSVNITAQTDKTSYMKGDTVNIALNLQNKQSAVITTTVKLRVTDPSNTSVHFAIIDVVIPANSTIMRTVSFTLPSTSQGGAYIALAEVYDSSANRIGGTSLGFELPLSQIAVAADISAAFNTGANTISFILTNNGKVAITSGMLDVSIIDPDGQIVSTVSNPFSINVSEIKTLYVALSIPALKFGAYTLSYFQSDETKTGKSTSVKLANTPMISVGFDKTSYRIRESANLSLTLTNAGKFNLDNVSVTVAIPDAGFSYSEVRNLNNVQSSEFNVQIPMPATMTSGQHEVNITMTLSSGSSMVQSSKFMVPESLLSMSLGHTAYTAGATTAPVVTNTGGVDTPVEYKLSLYDSTSTLIAETTNTETIQAGSTLALGLSIPSGAADGSYNLVVNYQDAKTGRAEIVARPLMITGVMAMLSAQTDKQAYLATESIASMSTITNLGTDIQNGNLHLQIVTAGDTRITKAWTSQYDFQQGTRSGVETYETPDTVTLVPYADNFSYGIVDLDRWNTWAVSNYPVTEQNGTLRLYLPSNPSRSWIQSGVSSRTTFSGDFDAQVDYNVVSSWNETGNNHPAKLRVDVGSWWVYIDLWGGGSPTFGTIDKNGYSTNVSTNKLQGKLRIRRVGSTYYTYYWNGSAWTSLLTYSNRPTGAASVSLYITGQGGNVETLFDNFNLTTHTYNSSGTMKLTYDSGRSEIWGKLSFNADTPAGTSIKFRTRTAESQAGLSNGAWSDYITASDSPITSPKGRWIEIETTLSTTDTKATPLLHKVAVTQLRKGGDILWQSDVPVNLGPVTVSELTNTIGALGATGKLYLLGDLTSSTGQTIATSEYPFYVIQGNTALLFNADNNIYRPGETVTVSGEVRNLAAIEAVDQKTEIKRQKTDGTTETLFSEIFSVPANGSHPFTFTTTAGSDGTVTLTGTVTQNGSNVVEIGDQYEVASPVVTAIVTAPDVVGNESFTLSTEVKNQGKVPATIQFWLSPSPQSSPALWRGSVWSGDAQTITIPAGETKVLQYSQQITGTTEYTFTFSGDLNQTVTKTVSYGLGANVQFNVQSSGFTVSEGKVAIPVTVMNIGSLDEELQVEYVLRSQNTEDRKQTKTYFVQQGGNVSDMLYYEFVEGSYNLSAVSSQPDASATSNITVLKEKKVDMTMSVGSQGSLDGLVPVTVNIRNLGFNAIDGAVRCQMTDDRGQTAAVWSGAQAVSQLTSQASQLLTFNINASAIAPGTYTVKAELFNNSGEQLKVQSSEFKVQGAVFALTQIPQYQAINAGAEAEFVFKVKNTGNQEGSVSLGFKAYDLIDFNRTEWLKPGEEKELAFSFLLPEDLEEKDYYAEYTLTPALSQVGEGVKKGQAKYHVAGINIGVTATLDKQNYNVGEMAHLTLNISDLRTPNSELGLFARVNYNGHEEQKAFTLGVNPNATLEFNVPLTQITGEKLFYGIYHTGGRSIHLNTIYVYKAGDTLLITTDKQVYDPGQTVNAAINSTGASGQMTLTGPGGYTETFEYTGAASKSIVLPTTMTAGTYNIRAQMTDNRGQTCEVSHPIDVKGIQVKIIEAKLDKGKYAATDTIKAYLTITSNTNLSGMLRTWVVDPSGAYTPAGEKTIVLSTAEPLLLTSDCTLLTSVSGIHRLVYGVYSSGVGGQGSGDGETLLSSGSEAFDVGDAVLLGVSSDKSAYPTNTEPVMAKVSLLGSVDATLEFQIDGTTVKTEAVTLNGFATLNSELPPVQPGSHSLKALLTSGGLTSVKETTFVYGSSMPDLTVVVGTPGSGIGKNGAMDITATVMDQGKDAAVATTVAFYDNDSLIEIKPIRALTGGDFETVTISWNVMGRAGEHTIKAVVDPDNAVAEFNELNNTGITPIVIPTLAVIIETDKDIYKIRQKVYITTTMMNLTATDTYSGLSLGSTAKDPSGAEHYTQNDGIATLVPSSKTTLNGIWNTTGLGADGAYTISQTIATGDQVLAQNEKIITLDKAPDFTLASDVTSRTVKQGENAAYTVAIDPFSGWSTNVSLNLEGLPSGSNASFTPDRIVPPGQSQTLVITTNSTLIGSHTLYLTAQGTDEGEIVAHTVPLTLDVSGYRLEATTETQTITQLETASIPINLTALNGYEGGVSLAITNLPNGTKANIRTQMTDTGGQTEISVPGNMDLIIQTSKNAKPGAYPITLTGDDGLATHDLNLMLNIAANPDIAAGIIATPGPGPKNPALVRVFTAEGMQKLEIKAFDTMYGANAISADIDGDGYDELIVAQGTGPNNTATFKVFKQNGTFMAEYIAFDTKYGLTLASGDLDGDWVDELVVGTGPDPKNPGIIKVLKFTSSGFTEVMTKTIYPDSGYGITIAAGDIDRDGIPELITAPSPGPNNPAKVTIWKYGQGALTELSAFTAFDGTYGVNISIGDLDGDNTGEIITGTGPDPKNTAIVRVYRANGALVKEFTPYDAKHTYGANVSASDMTSDGMAELIAGVGPGSQNESVIKVIRSDGTELGSFAAYPATMGYGVNVSSGNIGK